MVRTTRGSGAAPLPLSRPTLRSLKTLQASAGCGIAFHTPASPFVSTDALRRVAGCATPQHRIAGFIEERVHMPLTEPEFPPDTDARQPPLHQGQDLRPMACPRLWVCPAALTTPLFDGLEDGTIEWLVHGLSIKDKGLTHFDMATGGSLCPRAEIGGGDAAIVEPGATSNRQSDLSGQLPAWICTPSPPDQPCPQDRVVMLRQQLANEALPHRPACCQIVHGRAQDAQMRDQEHLVDGRHLLLPVTIHPGRLQTCVCGERCQRLYPYELCQMS